MKGATFSRSFLLLVPSALALSCGPATPTIIDDGDDGDAAASEGEVVLVADDDAVDHAAGTGACLLTKTPRPGNRRLCRPDPGAP